MFHKTKNVSAIPNYKLSVQFSEGVTKIYDVEPLFEKLPVFGDLKNNNEEFYCVRVDIGGPHNFVYLRLAVFVWD